MNLWTTKVALISLRSPAALSKLLWLKIFHDVISPWILQLHFLHRLWFYDKSDTQQPDIKFDKDSNAISEWDNKISTRTNANKRCFQANRK